MERICTCYMGRSRVRAESNQSLTLAVITKGGAYGLRGRLLASLESVTYHRCDGKSKMASSPSHDDVKYLGSCVFMKQQR